MEFFNVMLKLWNQYWKLFLEGLGMTLFMGLLTVMLSTIFGSIMALMRRSRWGIGKFRPLNAIAAVYVEVIRGTPILLQLYFFYFMLPQWLPFLALTEFQCVLIACCVNSTAYVCEIVRAGIVKETSLASTFFVGELMTQFKTIQGITYRVLEPLTIVGLIYFLVTFVLSKLIALLERRMNASER